MCIFALLLILYITKKYIPIDFYIRAVLNMLEKLKSLDKSMLNVSHNILLLCHVDVLMLG